MMKVYQWGLVVFVALVGWGSGLTAPAAAKVRELPESVSYVRTKHAMDIGAREKTKSGYKPIYIKKNKLLSISAMNIRGKYPHFKTYVAVTLGDIHYAKINKVVYMKKFIRYTTANFTPVKTLRAPIRTQLLRQGTGFVMSSTHINQPTYSSALFVTLDNYIQTYSQARMTKINDKWMNADVDSDFAKLKPTDSVKVTKLVKTGTAYKIDYARPLKSFSDKKIGPHHYRLTIKQLGRQYQNYTPIDDTYDTAASWTNFTINTKPYFSGFADWGLD